MKQANRTAPAGQSLHERGAVHAGVLVVVTLVLVAILALAVWVAIGPAFLRTDESLAVTGDLDRDLPGLRERSVVRAADGAPMAVLADEFDREVVALERIPEHVRQAVITAEDRDFYSHGGYDVGAIVRAAWANLLAGSVEQGGSTITQQLARINFLNNDETLARKVAEVSVARDLEDAYTKDELLERYLNQVYLGAGAYGFQAGAQQFFRTLVEDLTVEQGALLAGMIRSPTYLNPRRHPGPATARRNAVLRGMADEGYLDRAEAERLASIPVEVAPPWDRSPSDPYVVEAVKREFLNNETFGETVSDRIELLFAGGLGVHTTVRADLQDAAEHVVTAALPSTEGPTAALVALHPVTGGILALHGGRDFEELQFDLATQGRRQPGSALKPVTAAAALEEGLPLDISLPGNGPVTIPVQGAAEPFTVDNFGGQDHGTVDLREALVNSVNTAFANLIVESGVDHTIDLADRMGINRERAFGPPNTWGPAIVLGGLTHGVTPLEMASVYSVFANQGVRAVPHLIEKVVDGDGRVLYQREPVGERVIDESVAAAMVDMLTDVVARGTGTGAQFPGVQPLGKTGTTQDNADAWFIGAVPTVSTAVWVGHPEGHVPVPGMTGGSLPATLWREFMQFAVADTDVPPFADATADPGALPGATPPPSPPPSTPAPPPPPPPAPPAPPPPPPPAPPAPPAPPVQPPPPPPSRAPRPPPPPTPPPQPQPQPPPQPQPRPPDLPPATQPPAT